MKELITADTLPTKLAEDVDLQARFDELGSIYEDAGSVTSHNDSSVVHLEAGFPVVKVYSDGQWAIHTGGGGNIWLRIEGDPDPTDDMEENDIIIDGSVA